MSRSALHTLVDHGKENRAPTNLPTNAASTSNNLRSKATAAPPTATPHSVAPVFKLGYNPALFVLPDGEELCFEELRGQHWIQNKKRQEQQRIETQIKQQTHRQHTAATSTQTHRAATPSSTTPAQRYKQLLLDEEDFPSNSVLPSLPVCLPSPTVYTKAAREEVDDMFRDHTATLSDSRHRRGTHPTPKTTAITAAAPSSAGLKQRESFTFDTLSLTSELKLSGVNTEDINKIRTTKTHTSAAPAPRVAPVSSTSRRYATTRGRRVSGRFGDDTAALIASIHADVEDEESTDDEPDETEDRSADEEEAGLNKSISKVAPVVSTFSIHEDTELIRKRP